MHKKYLIPIFLCLFSLSFASTNVTISGTIKNSENKSISIQGDFYEMDIPLEPNGYFSKTITIEYVGKYILVADQEYTEVYLGDNASLNIEVDLKNFNASITFGGSLGPQNNYIQKRENLKNTILGNRKELYNKAKIDFLAQVDKAQKNIELLFQKTVLKDPYFVKMETQSLSYFDKIYAMQYDDKKILFANKSNNNPENILPLIQNEALYQFSMSYEAFVILQFRKLVSYDTKISPSDKSIEILPSIQNTFIKDCLIKDSYENLPINHPKRNHIIAKLAEQATHSKYQKKLLREIQPIPFSVGEPTPSFTYENYLGGFTSSYDLKGKYTYIDVWATWCGPCRYEIPFLQKIEEDYKNKNIQFVSISVDKLENKEKWKAMIDEKKLGGIQLLAGDDKTSNFIVGYKITTIPRFIILDPDGNIISGDAPRPSDPKLLEKFKEIGIH